MNDTFDAGSLVVTLTDLVPYADYEIKRFSITDVSVHMCCIDASDIHTSIQHVTLQCFEHGKVIEICNGIVFDFYPGLPNLCLF